MPLKKASDSSPAEQSKARVAVEPISVAVVQKTSLSARGAEPSWKAESVKPEPIQVAFVVDICTVVGEPERGIGVAEVAVVALPPKPQ